LEKPVALALHHHEPDFTHFGLYPRPAAGHWPAIACNLVVRLRRKIIRHRALICYLALSPAVPTFQPTKRKTEKKENLASLFLFFLFGELGPRARATPRPLRGGTPSESLHHIMLAMKPIEFILPAIFGLLTGVALLPFTIWLVLWLLITSQVFMLDISMS